MYCTIFFTLVALAFNTNGQFPIFTTNSNADVPTSTQSVFSTLVGTTTTSFSVSSTDQTFTTDLTITTASTVSESPGFEITQACAKADNCPIENTICRNSTSSACAAGGCDRGFFNDPRSVQSQCQPCSDLNLGESCEACEIDPSNSLPTCTDCGVGNYFDLSRNDLGECFCQCQTCPLARGCQNGSQICGYEETQFGFILVPSTCLAGQCQKFYLNDLQTFNSTCNLTEILLETNFLPNQFTIDDLIWFEDEFERYFFLGTRASYPYPCYPVKIAPDPDRANRLDIAITCDSVTDLSTVQAQLVSDILANPNTLPLCVIECFYLVTQPDPRPYGIYERRLCFNCDPIDGCLFPGYCDGDRRRSSCTTCEPGRYAFREWPPYADVCPKCTRATGCSKQNTRCVSSDESFCLTGFCNDGYYQNVESPQKTIGTDNVGECFKCPRQPGCKQGHTICGSKTEGVDQFLSCETGQCKTEQGYYNNDTCCAGDNSPCELPMMVYEMCFPESDWDDETEFFFLLELADFFTAAGTPGVAAYEYPWPFYVLGTRTNETSGNVLVDVNFTDPVNAQNLISVTKIAALGDITVQDNSRQLSDELAQTGTVCVVQPIDVNTTLTAPQASPLGRIIVPRPICLKCNTIENCIIEPVCPRCPVQSLCPTCQQGYFNNHSLSVWEPDYCVACPTARNCTSSTTPVDGFTVCVSSNDPVCLAGRCVSGYWNNPGPPPLDCGFQDAYKCWSKKEILKIAHNDTWISSDYALWWINEYGIEFVKPFYYCPYQGTCEVALWNVEEEKHEGYIKVPSEQVAFWNFWLPGWSENINYFQYWRPTDRDQIIYYQRNYQALIKLYGPTFGQCQHVEPIWASPCKRWTECDARYEFPAIQPTEVSDRVCLNCRQANETMCGGDKNAYQGCTDFYWNGEECSHCSNADYLNCGCGINAVINTTTCGAANSSIDVTCVNWFFNPDLDTTPHMAIDGNDTSLVYDGTCCKCEEAEHCNPGMSVCVSKQNKGCIEGECDTFASISVSGVPGVICTNTICWETTDASTCDGGQFLPNQALYEGSSTEDCCASNPDLNPIPPLLYGL
eukprot:CFRG6109T1